MLRGLMAEHGRYAEESATQHGATAYGFSLIGPAIQALGPQPEGTPLLIADFGAAQGTNSLEPIARALDALSEDAGRRPVQVVHTDIPGNDFTTLAETLETSPQRYTLDRPWALPLMAGRSLYTSIFAKETLHFAWTASTLHWLSRAPGPIPDHFFVQLSADDDARRAYRERSAADWSDFLTARAVELVVGAGIVIVDVAVDESGLFGSEALFDVLNSALRDCLERGTIDEGEFERAVYPTWFRSLEEVRAPFDPHFEADDGQRLDLVELRPTVFEDPFRSELENGDVQAYASSQAGFLEGFLGPSFASALDQNRPQADRDAALEAIWTRTRERIASEPTAVSPSYRLFTALVRRVR